MATPDAEKSERAETGDALPSRPAQRSSARRRVERGLVSGLRQRCGVREGDALLVACSGGADSVALLRALHALAPRRRWALRLRVAHVQHHLRDSAERDAGFVAGLADELGLAFDRVDLDLDGTKDTDGPARDTNLESRARWARYQALNQLALKNETPYVVTGHHADDQLETVLMRLMRGSASHGLSGIAWRRRVPIPSSETSARAILLRPLLGVTRTDLRAYLNGLGQTWVEDETNTDAERTRARLRAEVTPTLHAMAGRIPERLAALTDHARAVSRLLKEQAAVIRLPLARPQARTLNRAVLTEVLRQALIEAGEPRDRCTAKALGPVVKAITDGHGGHRSIAFRDHTVCITREEVSLAAKTPRDLPKRTHDDVDGAPA